MRYHEILIEAEDDLTVEPFDSIDPVSRKPSVAYRILRNGVRLTVIAGRFAKTPEEAIAIYYRNLKQPNWWHEPRRLPAPVPSHPQQRASIFEIVDADTITSDDAPDEYYYHVTSRPQTVRRDGLRPYQRPNMRSGFYRDYSVGKVFFCDRAGVPYWLERIAHHLEDRYDRPPKLGVVRFPKSAVADAQHDELGSRDSHEPAYFVTRLIGELPRP
jgi:hypothetical protein